MGFKIRVKDPEGRPTVAVLEEIIKREKRKK
jgi:hypothetical protein